MPATRAGQTAYELGLAFGAAATGSVMAAVYRNHVQAASPTGAPADVVREAAGNLGGGLAIAERLPGELGEAMAATVRNAFASGLHAVAIISGGPAAALLVLVLLLLRRVAPTGTRETPAAQEVPADGALADELAREVIEGTEHMETQAPRRRRPSATPTPSNRPAPSTPPL
ncbi:hypothetical protein ABZU75_43155 [Streptosporangium sp. NPDC005286]|uniref:hypothetical protein n=1 Tax=Streptosporangium sp. NPDC005286 TaxID=3154463 RepID=UPI0033BF1845